MEKIIYKKDSKGKARFISIKAEGSAIIQESGLIGSFNTVFHTKEVTPKNVGRVNETTAEEQAILEVESFVKDKLTKGYFLTLDEIDSEVVILPQLAKDYFKEKKKVLYGKDKIVVQAKLDGMRCLAFVKANGEVKLISRAGKPIENMMHIEKELSQLGIDIILDGELYVFGENFQTNMSYVKKYYEGKSERIVFNVYDVYDDVLPYIERTKVLSLVNSPSVQRLPYFEVYNEDEVVSYFEQFVREGYEGLMVKISKSGYKSNARVSELLKYKKFIDIQLPILDVIPADQRPDWGIPIYHWVGAKDNILKSNTKMSHEQRIDLLTNKEEYIGKMGEVRFFEYSDYGVPRFPVTVGIRLDK